MNLKTLRLQANQGLSMCMVLASAFAVWKLMSLLVMSNSPIVVVLSGSMEPAFQRGDILFLWNRQQYVDVGDVVVYKTAVRDVPIVHRVLREHKVTEPGSKRKNTPPRETQKLLTKGDNNNGDDIPLYPYGQQYLDRQDDVIGTVKGYIPKIGYVTILITENQYFKYAMVGLLAVSALFSNE